MTKQEIKLKVNDESELYSPMDPDQNMLSDDAAAYLSRVFLNKHRRMRENYVIRIISDAPVQEARIQQTIRKEFDRQKDDVRFALKRLMLKLICLAILGAAILSLGCTFRPQQRPSGWRSSPSWAGFASGKPPASLYCSVRT